MSSSAPAPAPTPSTIEQLQGEAYRNFVIHLVNPVTRRNYIGRLKDFMQYCQTENADQLLFNGDTKVIQSFVSHYLIHLHSTKGFAPSTVTYHAAALKFFYTMNDVTSLNWKKSQRCCPNIKRR